MGEKDSQKKPRATSMSLGEDVVAILKAKAEQNHQSVTGYIRSLVLGKPEFAGDVEAWLTARSKKLGVCRSTVIERVVLFAMMTERTTGKEIV
jgi:hypothetical protein